MTGRRGCISIDRVERKDLIEQDGRGIWGGDTYPWEKEQRMRMPWKREDHLHGCSPKERLCFPWTASPGWRHEHKTPEKQIRMWGDSTVAQTMERHFPVMATKVFDLGRLFIHIIEGTS